jgi:TonB family protein
VPSELINRDDIEAILVIKIRRDGTIMDVRFEKKSGNEIFDSSVWRAVQKANPLPPFPKTYSPPYEEIGIRFRPKDLVKGQRS